MTQKFITPVSMECTREQFDKDLMNELIDAGYDLNNCNCFDLYPIVITIGMQAFTTDKQTCERNFIDTYFIDHYNPSLFLALAAMTEGEDIGLGEYMFCIDDDDIAPEKWEREKGELVKCLEYSDKCENKRGSFGPGYSRSHWRKATKEELISHFTKGSLIGKVPTFETGDKVIITKTSKQSYWYKDKIGEIFTINGETMFDQLGIIEHANQWINPKDIKKIFTIDDLKNGKCAIENDGTVDELRDLIEFCFPKTSYLINGRSKYYNAINYSDYKWTGQDNTDLPTQSIKLFLSQIEAEQKQDIEIYPTDYTEFKDGELKHHPEEWKPKWGEEVEVRLDSRAPYLLRYFVGISPTDTIYPYITVDDSGVAGSYMFCRKHIIKELSMPEAKEILSQHFNCSPDQIEIV